ncbi:hypothetical protein F5Y19DRAFT_478592 [Xylariaceae sp. FL1651]|nr:hypothetical protein F5Y19DRAFT_478592 [Xylariaceae sp. FL1651]
MTRYAPSLKVLASLRKFNGERYMIAHNLGYGGFSTVRLARDEPEKWAILEIVTAEHSTMVGERRALNCTAASNLLAGSALAFVNEDHHQFTSEDQAITIHT